MAVPPCIAQQAWLRPPTQKNGSPVKQRSSGSGPGLAWSSRFAPWRTRPPCVWTTAFGSLVEPDVYTMTIASLGDTCCSTCSRKWSSTGPAEPTADDDAPVAHHSSPAQPGPPGAVDRISRRYGCSARYSGAGPASARPGTAAATKSYMSAPSTVGGTTMKWTSLWRSVHRASGGFMVEASGTKIAPIRVAANQNTTHSVEKVSSIATLVPLPIPAARSSLATRRDAASACA
jgi:hypothetical protein